MQVRKIANFVSTLTFDSIMEAFLVDLVLLKLFLPSVRFSFIFLETLGFLLGNHSYNNLLGISIVLIMVDK